MQAAIKILKKVDQYNEHRRKSGYKTIGIGIGIHTGSLMLRTVGEQERMDGSVIADVVNLKGKKELVLIYEIFDADPPELLKKKVAMRKAWTKALLHYYDRNFMKAYRLFKALRGKNPDDRIFDLYIKRCVRCIKLGVPEDW